MNTLLLKLVDKIKMISIVRNQLFMKRKQIKRDIFHFVLHVLIKTSNGYIEKKVCSKKIIQRLFSSEHTFFTNYTPIYGTCKGTHF